MRIFMLAVLAAAFYAFPAFADAVTTVAVPAVGVPPSTTVVTVPIGSYVGVAAQYLALFLGGAVVYGFRLLPAQLYALAMTMRADQLLTRALSYALNAVAGAAKDKVVTVDVRNQVLRELVTYVLAHGADAVKTFLGTPAEIAEKGFSRLEVPPEASKPDFKAIGFQAEMAAASKKEAFAS